MTLYEFKYIIEEIISAYHQNKYNLLMDSINRILDCNLTSSIEKMTSLTILLEGLYKHSWTLFSPEQLNNLRMIRWSNHYGTPTVPFLLTFSSQINQVCNSLRSGGSTLVNLEALKASHSYTIDHINQVLVKPNSIFEVAIPQLLQSNEAFIKTHNPLGGFVVKPCDIISEQFLLHAGQCYQNNGAVLEIGAGFGAASLLAGSKGVKVFCNDISAENLAVVKQLHLNQTKEGITASGDASEFILIPGDFPDELLSLPKKYFDAILISRVLHFFKGEKIDKAVSFAAKLLKPGGKLYLICETPYLKNWQRFLPEYEKRLKNNIEWPGEITNPTDYESSGRASSLTWSSNLRHTS
ncbi:class I SAM-dependent methyltransferase [Legionella sp. 16cNR16C]|uniref:class I SAM-dependent methyltransferase n=1 Tax=Legionella sp. 16cNR16C TaxID=2905656 RepID=UPI001E4C98D9|nr:class I SAM-dependent methyltransferase [Legionella sp. 16cNR16C]MCE3044642.1 class I SAM-dependent methyltransferase [Legionella sp. 16cNR16C]